MHTLCRRKSSRTSVLLLLQQFRHHGTIYSLSSGFGKAGVAVIRVSGPQTSTALKSLCKSDIPKPRTVVLKKLFDPESSELIDRGLVLWFPSPHSFTGEDVCEFHVHGGSAVISAVLHALGNIQGLEPAAPGEFTKRSFHNGKLDLTEVEGLGALIHAETEAQRQQAVRQMEGDLSRLYNDWRLRLLKCVANVEAYIDFSEDDNIEEGVLDEVQVNVQKLKKEIVNHLSDNRRGERLRTGAHVVIVGPPNVGKSSLLNHLCQRPAAIISPTAGTTRDVVETALNIGGFPVLLSDTAGLRETEDVVEREGILRALNRAKQADLTIVVLDAPSLWKQMEGEDFSMITLLKEQLTDIYGTNENDTTRQSQNTQNQSTSLTQDGQPFQNLDHQCIGLNAVSDTHETCHNLHEEEEPFAEKIIVVNKMDLLTQPLDVRRLDLERLTVCPLSCTTGEGMEELVERISSSMKQICGNPLAGNPSLTHARYRTHLKNCVEALEKYQDLQNRDLVLAARALRSAIRQIGKITGAVSSEAILDVIFRDFCIGK